MDYKSLSSNLSLSMFANFNGTLSSYAHLALTDQLATLDRMQYVQLAALLNAYYARNKQAMDTATNASGE